MKIYILLIITFFHISVTASAQDVQNAADKEAAYTRTIHSRAEKIVATLALTDSSKAKLAIRTIEDQYRNLNSIYAERDEKKKALKLQALSKPASDSAEKEIEAATDKKISALHTQFITTLSSELSPDQVTKVKDGLTYNVVKVTYDAYTDMIPALTTAQKDQIMAWLVEAREHAMDGESSEKKHWWFGKYKGRINNYLSAQGYDINKERQEWEKRKNPGKSDSK